MDYEKFLNRLERGYFRFVKELQQIVCVIYSGIIIRWIKKKIQQSDFLLPRGVALKINRNFEK